MKGKLSTNRPAYYNYTPTHWMNIYRGINNVTVHFVLHYESSLFRRRTNAQKRYHRKNCTRKWKCNKLLVLNKSAIITVLPVVMWFDDKLKLEPGRQSVVLFNMLDQSGRWLLYILKSTSLPIQANNLSRLPLHMSNSCKPYAATTMVGVVRR